jgi:hypothetical protein
LVFTIVFFLIDVFYSESVELNGIVVDRQYQAERTSVNTGGGYYESEEFLIMVDVLDEVFTVDCPSRIYYKKEKGDNLFFKYETGCFTNIVYGIYAIK